ncbi:hypothetical protein L1887_48992 [Cichorium endivia]|nr:hypothetical protein L1887_48992 [Cichorium endivia]
MWSRWAWDIKKAVEKEAMRPARRKAEGGGGGEVKVVEGRVGTVLLEDVCESAEPGAALDDDGAVLPLCVCGLQEVAGAVAFERATAGAEADEAERGGHIGRMEGDAGLPAPTIVGSRVEGLIRVDGAPAVSVAAAGSAGGRSVGVVGGVCWSVELGRR